MDRYLRHIRRRTKLAGHDFQFEEAKKRDGLSSFPQEGLGLLWSVRPPLQKGRKNSSKTRPILTAQTMEG